jgi:hypothetical protein
MPKNTISTHPDLEQINAMLETHTIKDTAAAFGVGEDALSRHKAKLTAQKLGEPTPDTDTPDDATPDTAPLEQPTPKPRRQTGSYTHPRSPEELEPLLQEARLNVHTMRGKLENCQLQEEQAHSEARQASSNNPDDLDTLDRLWSRHRASEHATAARKVHLEQALTDLGSLEHEVRAHQRDTAIGKNARAFEEVVMKLDQEKAILQTLVKESGETIRALREQALTLHHQAMGQGLPTHDPSLMQTLLLEMGVSDKRALELLAMDAGDFRQKEAQPRSPIGFKIYIDLNLLFGQGRTDFYRDRYEFKNPLEKFVPVG